MFHVRARRWPLLLLLTVFVSGGLVAPWVHGLEHALSSRHAPHEHADVEERLTRLDERPSPGAPAGFLTSERAPVDEIPCLLCYRQVVRSDVQSLPEVILDARGALALEDAHVVLAARLPALPIRAPPALS